MTPLDRLLSIRTMSEKIDEKQQRYDRMRAMATKTVSSLTEVPPSTHDPQAQENRCIALADLKDEINRDIDDLIEAKKATVESLKPMRDMKCHDLLVMRYICFRSWRYTANYLNCSIDHARGYLHKKAINYLHNM